MARFNREDARTVLPQLEKNIDALVERVKMFQTEFKTKHVISEKADMTEVNIKNMSIDLNDGVQIIDTGTTISVVKTGSAETDDYLLAKAIAAAFDYATAKEILEV